MMTAVRDTPSPVVRAYALTAGRAVPAMDLPIESLVERTAAGLAARPELRPEERLALDLTAAPTSVAEVAARMRLPLGVCRVIVADLAQQGYVAVDRAVVPTSGESYRALLERVLDGIRAL